jgi:hypothetical protein
MDARRGDFQVQMDENYDDRYNYYMRWWIIFLECTCCFFQEEVVFCLEVKVKTFLVVNLAVVMEYYWL